MERPCLAAQSSPGPLPGFRFPGKQPSAPARIIPKPRRCVCGCPTIAGKRGGARAKARGTRACNRRGRARAGGGDGRPFGKLRVTPR